MDIQKRKPFDRVLFTKNAIRVTAVLLIAFGVGQAVNATLGIGVGLFLTQVTL